MKKMHCGICTLWSLLLRLCVCQNYEGRSEMLPDIQRSGSIALCEQYTVRWTSTWNCYDLVQTVMCSVNANLQTETRYRLISSERWDFNVHLTLLCSFLCYLLCMWLFTQLRWTLYNRLFSGIWEQHWFLNLWLFANDSSHVFYQLLYHMFVHEHQATELSWFKYF